ncbi:helix-turn-helix domain-containing protein [Deinococcus deserti]|uniref:Putative transcriptional regulator, AraC family n=1 Tax=Deinococcus deserti (strain DSM 17065 / CIP 109153 / LMG 22923 / VCD115) TaxID=546414 RepID=C1D3S3_DEIDV|nr:helix-turn-helix domain-containing protein [Deinococcus deserti]ACO48152.2 putative transcriptional regulator, AraC family [Deinococcus deserti VCD115]
MNDPRRWLQPAPDGSWPIEVLLDEVPDLIFYVKDVQGRYVSVNETLRRRCGAQHKRDVLGRTAAEVFTGEPGHRFNEQDDYAMRHRRELRDVLEMYVGPQGEALWCLTHKLPVVNDDGVVVGLAGVSRDVPPLSERHADFARVAQALAFMHAHFARPLRTSALAAQVGLSEDSFERLMRRVCHMTPKQFLLRVRFDAALRLLRESRRSVADIAHECGYSDHSAFSRKFRAMTGFTPQEYRHRLQHAGRDD